jgi:excisionase family DNA binding protein
MLKVQTKSSWEQSSNMQVIASDDEVLKAKGVAEKLRVTPRAVHNMAASGALPAFKVGRLWRFKAGEVRKLMDTPKVGTDHLVPDYDAEEPQGLDALLGIHRYRTRLKHQRRTEPSQRGRSSTERMT